MQTIETLHNRALRACGAAADRALAYGSERLAAVAEQTRDVAERAFRRGDCGCLQRVIRTAAAIGRRVRAAAMRGGV